MKKTFVLLCIGAALVTMAATNAPVIPGPFGTPDPPPSVHALPNSSTVSPVAGYLSLIIPIVVPALIAGLKSWASEIPKWMLPIIAPALGALIDWVMQLSGLNTNGAITGALLGSAGVGLRELQDQIKQRMANPPPAPVSPPPPKAP